MTHTKHFLFPLLALLAAAVLLLSGCGKEELSFTTSAGVPVKATFEGGDDFSARDVEGTLSVYQKKKLMLRIAFISEDQRAVRLDYVKLMGGGQNYREDGGVISFDQAGPQGLVHYRIVPAAPGVYAYGGTYLPDDVADGVWKRVHFGNT